ncbi:hypothetical protein TNCV_4682531 [Trichonephila clavipes]|nr:hypothetical protein TNCV_4682531 [Trichonephila clavipes]
MAKLNQLDVLLVGYKKSIACQKTLNDTCAFANQTIQSMKESQAARDLLESELRSIPLCVDSDCPDHSSLESKNNETIKYNVKINELDKKNPQKRKNTKNNTDDFIFPNKTARPTTPVLEPVELKILLRT